MIDVVISALKSSSSVTTYVDADNIYPLFRLQGGTIPAIVVQLVDTTPVDTHDQAIDMDVHVVELTIFHTNPKGAWKTGEAVRARMESLQDLRIKETRFITQTTDVFEVQDATSLSQRYECSMTR